MNKRQSAKAQRRANKQEEKQLKESYNIAQFIKAVSEENYASAHKYLRSAIDAKIQSRIAAAISKPLF